MLKLWTADNSSIVLREPINWWLLWPALGVWAFMVCAMINDSRGEPPAVYVLAVIAALGTLLVWMRAVSMRVVATTSGVRIVNPLHTHFVAWSEIDHFELGYPEAHFWTWSPVLVANDSRRIPMPAIQSPNPVTQPKNDFGERATECLNEILESARENGGVPTPEALAKAKAL